MTGSVSTIDREEVAELNLATPFHAPRGPFRETPLDFEMLYEQHHRKVYSLCLRMLRNQADAEDLTQEVFLQVYRRLHTFRGEAAFATWLHRLTVNQVLMHLRRRPNEVVWTEPAEEAECSLAEQTLSTRLINRIDLEHAISQLPPGYRTVLLSHDVKGLNQQEIAAVLGIAEGTAKSQLHKARLRLRELLSPEQREKIHHAARDGVAHSSAQPTI